MQQKTYKRLTSFEREEISRKLAQGMTMRSIAEQLARRAKALTFW